MTMESTPRERAGAAMDTGPILKESVAKAWQSASEGLASEPRLIIAHAGVAHDQGQVLAAIRECAGDVPIVGGSSQGASISGRTVETARFVALAVICDIEVSVASTADFRGDAFAAGQKLAERLEVPDGTSTCLLYYDPLGGGDAQTLLDGIAAGGFPRVYGAATGQPWGRFVKTYQYAGGEVYQHGAVLALIKGLRPITGLTHGAESIGLELTVTRTEGNVVVELEGKPALDVWCEQLGVEPTGHVENSANWALGIKPPSGEIYEGLITRAPFALDNEKRTLILQAPIPEGSRVQVCTRSVEAVLGGAMKMAARLRAAIENETPVIALGFECGARPGPFLGLQAAADQIAQIQETIGAEIPWLGTYAWGEIAPVGDTTYFHNFTFPLCVLVS